MVASRTLTGNVLETVCAAALPLAVGDVQTDGHGPTDGPVAVGGNPNTQQPLQRKATRTPEQTGIYVCACAQPPDLSLVIDLAVDHMSRGIPHISLTHTLKHSHTRAHTHAHTRRHTHKHTHLIAIFAVNTGLFFPL